MLVSAGCDAVVGDWDEDRFFLYSEETDFAARTRDAGLGIEYIPEARARHRGGGSGQSDALVALMAINRIRYYEKRHGRLSSCVFRGVVALNELLRSRDRRHRCALNKVLRRSRWPSLPGGRPARAGG
jgi:GT2 family glycosyltransferase